MNTKRTDVVSASEIASWAYCPESWRLAALGNAPENRAALARGKRFHTRTAAFEVWSRRAVRVGLCLLVLALLASIVWYFLLRGAGG